MRTESIDLYPYSELSDKAKEKALEWWQNAHSEHNGGCFEAEEICDSMIKCMEAAGLKILDLEVGWNRGSYVVIQEFAGGNLIGKRAYAWLENNLLNQFRVPYLPAEIKKNKRYGNRPGEVRSCPFTGVCYDEDMIDSLKNSIKKGYSVYEAFKQLPRVACKLIDEETEIEMSEPYFADHADANNFEFTIDGHFWKGV